MVRFRRMKTLQKFVSVHANVHNHFNTERHLIDRPTYKMLRSAALAEWRTLMALTGAIKDQAAPNGDWCLLVWQHFFEGL